VHRTADLLSRIKRRIRVGWRSLVATNAYVLHTHTESSGATAIQYDRQEIAPPTRDVLAAQRALAAVAARRRKNCS
jgi:hypothetical protein